jgi:hypothetical protein
MRLTRNITPDGRCKYAAVRNDKIAALSPTGRREAEEALDVLATLGVLEDPKAGDPEEFLLIKLKDINAPRAYIAYAGAACDTDPELARDVIELAGRAFNHPDRKQPD